jgi:hypothetical protein
MPKQKKSECAPCAQGGAIALSEALGGMGLRFVNLSREDAATIRAFLARRVAGENPQK